MQVSIKNQSFISNTNRVGSYLVDTRRRFNVDTMLCDIARRRIDVDTTSCVYWVRIVMRLLPRKMHGINESTTSNDQAIPYFFDKIFVCLFLCHKSLKGGSSH